ncbi:ATP-dependent Clp protease ATP-binding subunit clpA [Rhynchospora pubera]|uniref:ATP-dependent Clp protease ATP-binding subunit clpA n=1 Tax=Rhynchospora pubera TaxID=906938 RepID=A0AAV8F911_9POAL|nr:ATP-dependent Clp protease ATP-binding subunit clpA [Rhynchospora pubera]
MATTTTTVQGLCFSSNTTSKPNLLLQPSLIGCPTPLSPRLRTPLSLSSRPRRVSTTTVAALALPTSKPERVTSDEKARWSARAVKSFALAELQARNMKRPKLGTEGLLLGLLVDGSSEGAKYLREMGITLAKVREETWKIIGELDRRCVAPRIGLPLSDSAQRALDWALDYKLKSGKDGEITIGHLVLGIWSQKESTGHKVLAALGFDGKKAKEFSKIAGNDAALSYR